MRTARRAGLLASLAAGFAGAAELLQAAAPPAVITATLRHSTATSVLAGPEPVAVAVAGAASWLVLGWLVLAVGLVAAAALPGPPGHFAAGCASVAVPATVRRLLALALGTALVATTGPAWAGAAPCTGPGLGGQRSVDVALAATGAPNLDWPTPTANPPAVAGAATPAPSRRSPAPAATVVVVRHGDSLWNIARRHLEAGATDAEVATAWPRWYAANRSVIGPTPGLLRPGQRLLIPTPPPGGPS